MRLGMANERTDVLDQAHDAWNAGDLDAVRAIYATDITADPGLLWPSSQPLSGAEPIIETFASIRETFERSEAIPLEYIEHGDTVIVPTRWRGVVAGNTIDQVVVASYTFRGDQISHIAYYEKVDEAVEALDPEAPAT